MVFFSQAMDFGEIIHLPEANVTGGSVAGGNYRQAPFEQRVCVEAVDDRTDRSIVMVGPRHHGTPRGFAYRAFGRGFVSLGTLCCDAGRDLSSRSSTT